MYIHMIYIYKYIFRSIYSIFVARLEIIFDLPFGFPIYNIISLSLDDLFGKLVTINTHKLCTSPSCGF